MLSCNDVTSKWEVADLTKACDFLFMINCTAEVGLVGPKLVGCSGFGVDALTCVCEDADPQPCEESKCDAGEKITLCKDDHRVLAQCSVLCNDDNKDGPVCIGN